MPTEKDRAYDLIIRINKQARFDTGEETFSLEYLTDEDPQENKSNKDGYKDEPGTKPYNKGFMRK